MTGYDDLVEISNMSPITDATRFLVYSHWHLSVNVGHASLGEYLWGNLFKIK